MEEEVEYCHKCERETSWVPIRGGKRLKCSSCGDVFPCYNDQCGHLDCADGRERK